MLKLEIHGKASNKKIKEIDLVNSQSEISLMDFLRMNEIPIASSCYGEGICKKCVFNRELLSCQIKISDIIHLCTEQKCSSYDIEIDYL